METISQLLSAQIAGLIYFSQNTNQNTNYLHISTFDSFDG